MKRIIIFLAVVAAVVLVIVAIPARTFAMLLDDYDVHLLEAQGTVWNGSAQLVVPGTRLGTLQWDILPKRLLGANLAYNISVSSPAFQATGVLVKGLSKTSLLADARLQSSLVNSILIHYELKISGSFQIDGIDLSIRKNKISSLDANIEWNGGRSRYRAGPDTREVVLPPMMGRITASEGDLILTAVVQNDETELLNARLDADSGWLHIGLTRQLFDLVGMPWDLQASAGTEVMKISRRILK